MSMNEGDREQEKLLCGYGHVVFRRCRTSGVIPPHPRLHRPVTRANAHAGQGSFAWGHAVGTTASPTMGERAI